MKKRRIYPILISILIGSLWTGSFFHPAYGVTEPPAIMGSTACVMDLATGTVIYDKDMHGVRPPASTTKMMTALLVLENLPLDTQVIIDSEVVNTGGNTLAFKDGEIISVEDLMYGMLLYSANDAAVALAKQVAGSVPKFAEMMNQRAQELGAMHTTFQNPHGLTEEGHVSTAYDLALIARAAMENEVFREMVKTDKYTITANFLSGEREIFTTNLLLADIETMVTIGGIQRPVRYEDCIGVKTGFTLAAGNCLVAAAAREETEFLSVVLNSGELERFSDSIQLLDWSFDNYRNLKAVQKGEPVGTVRVKGGSQLKPEVAGEEDSILLLPNDAADSVVSTQVHLDEGLVAPLSAGAVVGQIQVLEGDRVSKTVNAVLLEDVPEGTFLTAIGIPDSVGKPLIKIGIGLIALLVVGAVALLLVRMNVKRKKQRLLQEKAREIAARRLAEERDKENRNWRF